jgi:hypothetical protein
MSQTETVSLRTVWHANVLHNALCTTRSDTTGPAQQVLTKRAVTNVS